jgi:ferritin
MREDADLFSCRAAPLKAKPKERKLYMLSEKIEKALNEQVNFELFSAYTYFSMSAWFDAQDLPGFANWMRIQAQEELLHVKKFYDFINDRDGRVIMEAIEKPRADWESPLAVIQNGLEHEREVTGRIHKLVDVSLQENDHATNSFLQWFVNEQVEEEANFKAIQQRLKLIKGEGHGLFMVDMEMGKRTLTIPADIEV